MDIHAENTVPVIIENKSFCFTGRAKMKRCDMEAIVTSRGGAVHTRVTRDTDYLVVGGKGSPGWAYRSFGNKILRAHYLRAKGYPVCIIPEEVFWKGVKTPIGCHSELCEESHGVSKN